MRDSKKQNQPPQAASSTSGQLTSTSEQDSSILDNRLESRAQQIMQLKFADSAWTQRQHSVASMLNESAHQETAQLVRNDVAQLQIGDAGNTLIGKKVIESGKKQPWTILSTQGEGDELKYQLDMDGLQQKWVSFNDDAWSVHGEEEVELDETSMELAALIDKNKTGNTDGVIDNFGDFLVNMADIHNAKKGAWSGGASDCVIVGGFTGDKVMMTHADRTSVALARGIIAKCPTIYLASEVFGKGGEAAICNGNVRAIVDMLVEAGKPFVVYNSTRMAISGSGAVFTNFENPG